MAQRFSPGPGARPALSQRFLASQGSPLRQFTNQNNIQNRLGFNGPNAHGGNIMPQQGLKPLPTGPPGSYMQNLNRIITERGAPPVQAGSSYHPYNTSHTPPRQRRKIIGDKILPPRIRTLIPESRAYMDLLTFERKLDSIILRRKLETARMINMNKVKPLRQKRKCRVFITNIIYPAKEPAEGEEKSPASWELRIEGHLLDEPKHENHSHRREAKFSSFFKSLVIELDKDLYGPDNYLVEWHKLENMPLPEGFKVKRVGDKNVKCKILLWLDYQPSRFKLDPRLARLLGVHTQSKCMVVSSLWQYIKTHKLQDADEKDFINCDRYLQEIFACPRMRFGEIPQRLQPLLHPADPILINHVIDVTETEQRKTTCYEINVEVEDPIVAQMMKFMVATAEQPDIQHLNDKLGDLINNINISKTNHEFYLRFSKDPQEFIEKWLTSQSRDLKTLTDVTGDPEEERRCEFFDQAWVQEAVSRYFYNKLQQKRMELEQGLRSRNN